jgi:uncharacterized membrane protein YqhA
MRTILEKSRYLVALPAIASVIGGIALLLIGVWEVGVSIINLVVHAEDVKVSVVEMLTAVDTLLLGTVVLVVGYGLYELFVDQSVKFPAWLEISSLDDLKTKLIGVVVTIIGISFLGFLVDKNSPTDVMSVGIGVGAVLLGLAVFSWATSLRK